MKNGDVIIHSFVANNKNQFQWMYCLEDEDKTKGGFASGCNKKITSVDAGRPFFNTREEAIADVRKYAKEGHLTGLNIIN